MQMEGRTEQAVACHHSLELATRNSSVWSSSGTPTIITNFLTIDSNPLVGLIGELNGDWLQTDRRLGFDSRQGSPFILPISPTPTLGLTQFRPRLVA
jgi:hypothetical protein